VTYEQANKKFANQAGDFRQYSAQNTPTWMVAMMPYLEEGALYSTWARAVGYGGPSSPPLPATTLTNLFSSPVSVVNCPTRRPARAYPFPSKYWISVGSYNKLITKTVRSDYALNGGSDKNPIVSYANPKVSLPGIWEVLQDKNGKPLSTGRAKTVRRSQVTDGLSKTYFAGEKMIPEDAYENGLYWGDQGSLYTCPIGDCVRFSKQAPEHDIRSYKDQKTSCWSCHNYGSAHRGVWNAVFCDGSVHAMAYTISFSTHKALSSRAGVDMANPREF
jgi:hypothetical protein